MAEASIQAEDVGVRFLFDHYQRAVTPALARLRRRGTETWGVRGMDLEDPDGHRLRMTGDGAKEHRSKAG